jgi:hypothetical protein
MSLRRSGFNTVGISSFQNMAADEDSIFLDSPLMRKEIEYLRGKFNNFCISGKYCFGYFNGEEKQLEDVLDNLQLITSTCYVRSESHSKEKGHKRLSLAGMELYVLTGFKYNIE